MLRLLTRFYRTVPLSQMGYELEEVCLDEKRTALVVMHCWDIGCEGGQPLDERFWVGMGSREATAEAARIMRDVIRPLMDEARAAGVTVCHVESADIAARYPAALADAEPVQPSDTADWEPSVVPGWRDRIVARSHGQGYATNPPYAGKDRALVVAPLPGEPFVFQTRQMHRVLRRLGVENLIYTGFAADMCILRAQGGIEHMAPYGYRIFLVRDATLGIEFPDTIDQRLATQWAIRYFETHYGNTVLASDLYIALQQAKGGVT
ncbi:MAG: cysteine hydrolase family protein [Armatimonadetes bacterium]|nr:cysteine hydrolase family protein [Armatimonadota bacterium]